jgi:hypothetical protein
MRPGSLGLRKTLYLFLDIALPICCESFRCLHKIRHVCQLKSTCLECTQPCTAANPIMFSTVPDADCSSSRSKDRDTPNNGTSPWAVSPLLFNHRETIFVEQHSLSISLKRSTDFMAAAGCGCQSGSTTSRLLLELSKQPAPAAS